VSAIAAAFVAACRDEIDAPKPGNVHIYADGHGMSVDDFLCSAAVAAPGLCATGTPVGTRILVATEATLAAVGQNTNLGIVLLCAPLAAAAERGGNLRDAVRQVLDGLTRADADAAFRAIRRAEPAGLGRSQRHDVHAPAEATLRVAMQEAAERDRIAFQYVSGFEDVFATGCAAIEAMRRRGREAPWPAVGAHLAFLSRFPDTHIVRKHGTAAAALVQREASEVHLAFLEACDPESVLPALLVFDRKLKERQVNPGTTADLVVAALFADRLTRSLIAQVNDG
jgi:triphosphoribosyl-dephospho-CoA synthase